MANHSPRFLELVEHARARVKEISLETYLSQADHFALIDVREDHEWEMASIPSATHLGKGVIERDIENHFSDLSQPLVLYCGGGFRSVLAAEQLQKMGYTQVYSLIGGWKAWSTYKNLA